MVELFDTIRRLQLNGMLCYQQRRYKSARNIFITILKELRTVHKKHILQYEDKYQKQQLQPQYPHHQPNDGMVVDTSSSVSDETMIEEANRGSIEDGSTRACSVLSDRRETMSRSSSNNSSNTEETQSKSNTPSCRIRRDSLNRCLTTERTVNRLGSFYIRPIHCSEELFFTGAFHLPLLSQSSSSLCTNTNTNIDDADDDADADFYEDDMDDDIEYDENDIVRVTEYSSAVVLYNIGLTLHMIGNETGSSIHYEKAKFFYEQSFRLVQATLNAMEEEEEEEEHDADDNDIDNDNDEDIVDVDKDNNENVNDNVKVNDNMNRIRFSFMKMDPFHGLIMRLRSALCLNLSHLYQIAFYNELGVHHMMDALSDELSCWIMIHATTTMYINNANNNDSMNNYNELYIGTECTDFAFFHQCLCFTRLINHFHTASAA